LLGDGVHSRLLLNWTVQFIGRWLGAPQGSRMD
jgi:hypothetical protein